MDNTKKNNVDIIQELKNMISSWETRISVCSMRVKSEATRECINDLEVLINVASNNPNQADRESGAVRGKTSEPNCMFYQYDK